VGVVVYLELQRKLETTSFGNGLVKTADPRASEKTIYLIEPEEQERQRLEVLLKHYYENVAVFDTTAAFIAQIDTVTSGCVVISSVSSEMNTLEFVKWLQCKTLDLVILVLGDEHNVQHAVSLLRAGANDFLERPFTDYKLRLAVNRVLQ